MKNPIYLALFAIVGYFIFIHDSTFKQDFDFNGETYSHVKKMSGGQVTNHFYTANGEDFERADNFIQILETSDAIQKGDWARNFKPLFSRYKLVPVESQEFELAGNIKKAGMFFNSYAAPVDVEEKNYMAFYIVMSDTKPEEESNLKKMKIIGKIKNIHL